MLKKSMVIGFAASMLVLVLAALSFAQETTGNIVGTAKDSNGAAISGATVRIDDVQKKVTIRTVTTNEDGEFNATNLPAGTYNVSVEASSFKKSLQKDVKVDVGSRRQLDVTLEAGSISEVVTVQADAVSIETSTPQVSTTINGDQVRELSINNRNWVQLVTLAPGVTNDLEDFTFTGTSNPETQAVNRTLVSVNGSRPTQNTFTVDGADVTDRGSGLTIQAYPSVESIGEFRVLRSMYPAESGSSGGGQINVVSRSGGDKFHGSAFEFVRNERLNANAVSINNLVNPPAGREANGKAKRRPFRYNDYGFTIGGPVYFLNILDDPAGEHQPFAKMPRTYFFFSEEQRHDIRFPTLASVVPTTAVKNGVFPMDICLKATGTTCTQVLPANTPLGSPGNGSISPVAAQYINMIWKKVPDPQELVSYTLNYPTKNLADFRQEIIKIDHTVNSKMSGYFRFENDVIPTTEADGIFNTKSGMPGVNTQDTNSPGRTYTAAFTYAPTSNLIIDGRFTHGGGGIFSTTTGLIAKTVSPIQVPLAYENVRDTVPVIGISGFNTLQGFSNGNNFSWKQNASGNVTWITGNHTFKFGAQFGRTRKNENALGGFNQGQFNAFNVPGATATNVRAPSTVPNPPTGISANLANTLQNWANFMQGGNVNFTQVRYDLVADLRNSNSEAYGQDEWRIKPNVTLYLGVRWSYFGPFWDKNGHLSNFVPSMWSAAAAPQVTGAANRLTGAGVNWCNGLIVNSQNVQTGPASFNCAPTSSPYGKYVYHISKLNFAPRAGIAWDPFKKGKTAIRAGFGMYYDQIASTYAEGIIIRNPPFQETCTINATTLDNAVPGGNCAAVAGAAVSSLQGIQADFKTPYIEQWSLDWQQQLTSKTVITVGYYGSKGVHLNGFTEYNNLKAGTAINTQCIPATGAGSGNTLQNPNGTATVFCQTAGLPITGTPAIFDQIRPYRGYRSLNILETRYNSKYWGLQVSAQQRFSGASQINLAYTWSKNTTDNPTSYISAAPQDNNNIGAEWGLAPLDRRHVITVNAIYELPFLRKQEGLVGKLFGGIQLSSIMSYQTGSPYTVTSSSYDPAGIGFNPSIIAGGRPMLLCDPNANAPHTYLQWFDTSCFAPQNAGPPTTAAVQNIPGNAGRGIITGPPTRKIDLTVAKNYRFGENFNVQLRAEAFNVFNLQNWRIGTTPSLSRIATTFGQVTSYRDPRIIQLGIKMYF